MSAFEYQDELRQVADAMYDRAEYEDDETGNPFAVIDMAGEGGAPTVIREFVPLYVVAGEESPQMRKESITWGPDQDEGLTFLDKFYEENELLSDRASDGAARLAAELFLSGKRRYMESGHERAPDGSICLLGMVAVYTYKTFESTFHDYVAGRAQEWSYTQVDKLSAMFIVPRSIIRLVTDDISDFAETNRLPVLSKDRDWTMRNSLTNASHGEAVVLGALSHILAPDDILHPHIKESLF